MDRRKSDKYNMAEVVSTVTCVLSVTVVLTLAVVAAIM